MKSTRSLTTALAATAIAFGTVAFIGSRATTVQAEEPHKHMKLHEAHDKIHDAEEYLKMIPVDFHGKKTECLKRLHEANEILKEIWDWD